MAPIMVALAMAICIHFAAEIGQAVLAVLMAAASLPSAAIVPLVSIVLLMLAACTVTGRRCWVRLHLPQHNDQAT